MLKGFIFDLDGVITDTAEYHYRAWKRLADEEDISFTRQDNEQLRGVSRQESLRRLLKGKEIDEATAQAWMERKNAYYRAFLASMTPDDLLRGAYVLVIRDGGTVHVTYRSIDGHGNALTSHGVFERVEPV